MAGINAHKVFLLQHVVLFCLSAYSILASKCPQSCNCQGSRNLTVNCSNSLLLTPPLTSVSTLTLDLSNNALGSIINASFVQMRELTLIDLSHNGLTQLLGCTFNGMLELRTVRIKGNRLSALPDILFTDSNKLENLDISFNLFTELPDEVFRPIPGLKILDVSHNQIVQLKLGDKFQNLRYIQLLDFSNNHIETLRADTFQATSNWDVDTTRSINLGFCRLTSIEEGAFSPISKLTSLDLSGNSALSVQNLKTAVNELKPKGFEKLSVARMNLSTVAPLFEDMENLLLKFLNLSFNSITGLPGSAFPSLQSLQVLDLSRNLVSTLNDTFPSLDNLRVLNMSYNRMEAFQGEAVSHMTSLQLLDLSHNKLDDHNRVSFSALANLRYLSVRNNTLSSAVLPSSTANLQYLDYQSNRIREIHPLNDATNLEFVDFSSNRISSLPGLLFKGASFMKLVNFSRNSLSSLDQGAFLPQSSITIDLSYNMLKELRYSNWVATQKLYLGHNNLATIDSQALYGMTGLEELDLSNNKLVALHEDLLQYLTSLKYLNLSHNGLDNLQWFSLFRGLEVLVTLDLSYNNMSRLSEIMFLPLPKLETLSLRNNRLRNVEPKTFDHPNEFKFIDLSNNPFDCSCDSLSFRDWLKRTQMPVFELYDRNSTAYHCRTPHERAGIHVIHWNEAEFECDKSMLYVIVFCSTFFSLTIIGIIAAATYRRYRKWRQRKDEIRKEAKLEEERSKLVKKADFVRLSNQKRLMETRDRPRSGQRYEDVDRRNGYVPYLGRAQRQHETERPRVEAERDVDKRRDIYEEKTRRVEKEGNEGAHYERLKRGERMKERQDKQKEAEFGCLNETGSRRDKDSGRQFGCRESEDSDVFSRRHDRLGTPVQRSQEEYSREGRLRREFERKFSSERDLQYRDAPYIISHPYMLPARWDIAHSRFPSQTWINQGYRHIRGQGHKMEGYSTLPSGDRELTRHERDYRDRERLGDNVGRYPLEVHFDEEVEAKHSRKPDGNEHDNYYHQRPRSFQYLSHDVAGPSPDPERSHREYESIDQTQGDPGSADRYDAQLYLTREASSGWL